MLVLRNVFAGLLISLLTLQAHAGWSRWTSMGGSYTEDPDICAELPGGGRAHLVARGGDGAIWWRQWDGSNWGAPISLGGSFMFSPTVSCRKDRIDVFAVAMNRTILWKTFRHATGQWGDWRIVNGMTPTSAPAAVAPNSSNIYLFVRGTDGHLWTGTSANERFNAWRNLGGNFVGKPAAALWRWNQKLFTIELAVQGVDGQIWGMFRYFTDLIEDRYSEWYSVGPAVTSSPEVTYQPNIKRYDHFARNSDNTIGHKWRPIDAGNRESSWENLGGIMASGPGAVWVTNTQLVVTMRGNDNALYYRVFNR